jgi:hypothetical protein
MDRRSHVRRKFKRIKEKSVAKPKQTAAAETTTKKLK